MLNKVKIRQNCVEIIYSAVLTVSLLPKNLAVYEPFVGMLWSFAFLFTFVYVGNLVVTY